MWVQPTIVTAGRLHISSLSFNDTAWIFQNKLAFSGCLQAARKPECLMNFLISKESSQTFTSPGWDSDLGFKAASLILCAKMNLSASGTTVFTAELSPDTPVCPRTRLFVCLTASLPSGSSPCSQCCASYTGTICQWPWACEWHPQGLPFPRPAKKRKAPIRCLNICSVNRAKSSSNYVTQRRQWQKRQANQGSVTVVQTEPKQNAGRDQSFPQVRTGFCLNKRENLLLQSQ